mgnify:CR=1 FL=1
MSDEWKSGGDTQILGGIAELLEQFAKSYQNYLNYEVQKLERMVQLRETLTKNGKQ